MRIRFNSKKSLAIWGVVWIILAAIASTGPFSMFWIPVLYWTFAGSHISDSIVDKDWDALKYILIISILIASIILVSIYWD